VNCSSTPQALRFAGSRASTDSSVATARSGRLLNPDTAPDLNLSYVYASTDSSVATARSGRLLTA